jgi:hypothetical protein
MNALFVVFLFLLRVLTANAADDHGDTPQTATLLTSDQVTRGLFIPGNIEEAGDVDYFAFVVEPQYLDYLYVIETTIPTSDPFSDTYLRLIGTNGITQLAYDDDSGGGNESKISWASPAAGTYYVEVSQAFSEDVGTYSVSVFRAGQAPPDDHGDHPDQATLLVVNDPAQTGETELPGDNDYFQFVVQPGRFYDIETSNLGDDSDTVLSLIANNKTTVLGTDDQGGREFNASRILWISDPDIQPPADIFYIKVNQFLPSAKGTWEITVKSTGTPSDLVIDGTQTNQGFLEVAGEVDAYVVSATENYTTQINLATTNEINHFELSYLDQDGISVLMEQTNLETEDLVISHEETGDHFLLVTEPYVGGAYVLSATTEPPPIQPDVNGDGIVNDHDLLYLMMYYHQEPLAQ